MESIDDQKMTRNERTPGSEAVAILDSIADWFLRFLISINPEIDRDHAESFFLDNILEKMLLDKTTSGDYYREKMRQDAERSRDQGEFPGRLHAALAASAYCIQAIRSQESNTSMAWTYVVDATYWGCFMSLAAAEKNSVSMLAKKAADARHEKNRQTGKQIIDWFEENRSQYKSLDAAAEAAAKKFSRAFRTARKHIGQANKRPSARKE